MNKIASATYAAIKEENIFLQYDRQTDIMDKVYQARYEGHLESNAHSSI